MMYDRAQNSCGEFYTREGLCHVFNTSKATKIVTPDIKMSITRHSSKILHVKSKAFKDNQTFLNICFGLYFCLHCNCILDLPLQKHFFLFHGKEMVDC